MELPDVVAASLREHLKRDYSPVEVDDDTDPRRPTRRLASLVFRGANGDPVIASTFSRTWTPVRATVGLPPRWGFHGLRHYYATLLIHAGASIKTVQLALGHSKPTITLNEYVHEWPDAVDRRARWSTTPWECAKRRPLRLGAGRDRRFLVWAEPGPKINSASVPAGHRLDQGQTL